MFIVVPYLTSQPAIYGIYSVCISVSIFLSYADLGFLGAGQKYASEYFAKGDREKEMEIIGFTNFILLVFLSLFSLCFLILSLYPWLLIKNLSLSEGEPIASNLLLILALFTPATLLQRLLQMIFGIRLEDYIIQRNYIIANLLKILSVLWFFRKGEYNIVGYFLFVQIVNLFASILTLLIAKQRYNYDFKRLLKSVHFNKDIFVKTKNLAFTSLYLMITWILYYELDPAVIGKFIGTDQVAIYAIGLTILSFFRSIQGILFSPFNARFNHLIGINDVVGLKSLFTAVTTLMMPVICIPVVTVCLMAKPLILSWVGSQYTESINIARFLILCNLFAFITYPASLLIMAQERIKEMYMVNTLIPVVYWCGIVLSFSVIGLISFAFFKFVAFTISAIVYFFIIQRYLSLSPAQLYHSYIRPVLLPVVFLFLATFIVADYMPAEKSKMNLLISVTSSGFMIIIAFLLTYFSSPFFKSQSKKVIALILDR
jgi:O-antigen/teichoic acid export membrane protein